MPSARIIGEGGRGGQPHTARLPETWCRRAEARVLVPDIGDWENGEVAVRLLRSHPGVRSYSGSEPGRSVSAGVHPKVVQERLGHSTIGVTLNTYSHVSVGMQREAAETVAGLIFGY